MKLYRWFAFLLVYTILVTAVLGSLAAPCFGSARLVDVTFRVHIPASTPPGEPVYLLIMPFHDWDWRKHVELSPVSPGVLETTVPLEEGSLIRYTYDRWDEKSWSQWKTTREAASNTLKIDSRLLVVSSEDSLIEDTVAAWADINSVPQVGSLAGRVVDAVTSKPLVDTNVVAGGIHIATDYDGYFEFPELAVGTQRVMVYRTLGDHHFVETTAVIKEGEKTTLNIAMSPAQPVSVTFDVALPANTPEYAEIRIFGSAYQLGARISGNDLNTPPMPGMNLPVMQRDGNHATLSVQLFDGMHIEYHYSISTWFYGSERDSDGQMVDRTLVVSPSTTHQIDWITRWGSPGTTLLSIYVTTPSSTPAGVPIVLDNGPMHWMTQVGSNKWVFYAYGNPGDSFSYSYVLGGDMDGIEKGNPTRTAIFGTHDTVVEDTISAWAYIPDDWTGSDTARASSDGSTPLTPPDFICGYYPVDYWSQSFVPLLSTTFDRIRAHNGTWVAVSSIWSYGQVSPMPTVESRPLLANSVLTPRQVLINQIKEAHTYGLHVLLAPQFGVRKGICGSHSDEWWEGWIKEARKLWMWNAQVAQETGTEALLLPGYCFHAFPSADAFSGEAEVQAFDKAIQSLIADVRTVFHGSLLIGYPGTSYDFPSLADWVGITTYQTGHPNLPASASVEEWETAYDSLFMRKLDPLYTKYRKPIVMYQVAVPSTPSTDDPTGEQAQARQLEGLLQALRKRAWVIGTFSFAYTMIDTPLKPGDGIRAREGENVLKAFYGMETSQVDGAVKKAVR